MHRHQSAREPRDLSPSNRNYRRPLARDSAPRFDTRPLHDFKQPAAPWGREIPLLLPEPDGALRPRERPRIGGGERNRTDDLLLAKQALSRLSYAPSFGRRAPVVGLGRVELPTSRLSGVRSNRAELQAPPCCALRGASGFRGRDARTADACGGAVWPALARRRVRDACRSDEPSDWRSLERR